MKKLIFCLSVILLLSCNEKQKKEENTVIQTENSSEKISETNIKSTIFEKQIIPGKRIGNIILEENATAVLDSLGKPDSSDAAMGKAISTWNKGDSGLLTLITSTQMGVEDFSRIKAIRSLSKDFKTVDNLGISSSIAELKKYYRLDPVGKFTDNGKHYYLYTTPKGIAFEMGMNQKCNGVLLYSPGADPESFFTSMYQDFKKL
jgi:hypothetical protein